jgi:hypothetical protein
MPLALMPSALKRNATALPKNVTESATSLPKNLTENRTTVVYSAFVVHTVEQVFVYSNASCDAVPIVVKAEAAASVDSVDADMRVLAAFATVLFAVLMRTASEGRAQVRAAEAAKSRACNRADVETARADEAQVRADEAQVRADEAQVRADAERVRADEAQVRSDAEKVRSDAERVRSDAEKVRAMQAAHVRAVSAMLCAEQERARADEANVRAAESKGRADVGRLYAQASAVGALLCAEKQQARADMEKARADDANARADVLIRETFRYKLKNVIWSQRCSILERRNLDLQEANCGLKRALELSEEREEQSADQCTVFLEIMDRQRSEDAKRMRCIEEYLLECDASCEED